MIGLSFGIRNPIKIIGGGGGGALSPVNDLDALAYVTAANITDSTERTAVDNFVIALKACNMWDRMYAFYPLLGNSLSQTTYNLKDPATYQIIWTGSPTLVAKGLQFDGTTQHGDTNFSPISVPGFSIADFMFGCYDATGFNSRTEIPMGITETVDGTGGYSRARAVWFSNNANLLDIWSFNEQAARVTFNSVDGNGQAVGHWAFVRRSASEAKVFYFNTGSGSNYMRGQNFVTINPSASFTNKMFLAATSDGVGGANTPSLRSNKLYKYFYMSKAAIDDAQFLQFRLALYNFQTAVGK